MMGLLEARRRYGGEPDEQFESYLSADPRRHARWLRRQIAARQTRSRRTASTPSPANSNQLGREPSEQALADAMSRSLAEVRELLYASQAEAMQSLDELLEVGSPPTEQESPISRVEQERALGPGWGS
jgi:RNA polymerase sigma factor for flagellar operon FliA